MRIFILCTGRSGSSAIIKACKHIKNYSASHESLSQAFGKERFNYPDNHIEADNRLCWHLGHLNKYYADEPFYVHLKRNKEKTAQSFMKRFYQDSIIDSFCGGIRMMPSEILSKQERLQACYDYIDTITLNVEHFLSDKNKVMIINLETIEKDFEIFWSQINAEGNFENAINEFKNQYNSSKKRKLNYKHRLKMMAIKEWRHITMYMKS